MKELIKPNPVEQEYEEIGRYCDFACVHRLPPCLCRGTDFSSVGDEEDILF